MATSPDLSVRKSLETIYKKESRRILATLIRLLGDFDLAEDALHDAFEAATARWEAEGVPANPVAWLVSTGRFKAIDRLRREARFGTSLDEIAEGLPADSGDLHAQIDKGIEDDELRLIFTCCHPFLSPEARVALTLREVCGLTTEEIARSFLTPPATLAQRIVRAKTKIKEDKIPYQVPPAAELPERLDAVLQVIYLVFNEGYSPTQGEKAVRAELSGEAIRLGRLLLQLLPEPEVMGLLALMLLQESRRAARTTSGVDIVLIGEQDRTLWNRDQIREGIALIDRAFSLKRFGAYTLQAAIAATHSRASAASDTDWGEIVGLYEMLYRIVPTPVVELNRAVAVAMKEGPESGLRLIDAIFNRGELKDYHFAYSARGELCGRMGRIDEAISAYQRALGLTQLEPEKRLLEGKIRLLNQKKIAADVDSSAGHSTIV